jgi:hypothetical protein
VLGLSPIFRNRSEADETLEAAEAKAAAQAAEAKAAEPEAKAERPAARSTRSMTPGWRSSWPRRTKRHRRRPRPRLRHPWPRHRPKRRAARSTRSTTPGRAARGARSTTPGWRSSWPPAPRAEQHQRRGPPVSLREALPRTTGTSSRSTAKAASWPMATSMHGTTRLALYSPGIAMFSSMGFMGCCAMEQECGGTFARFVKKMNGKAHNSFSKVDKDRRRRGRRVSAARGPPALRPPRPFLCRRPRDGQEGLLMCIWRSVDTRGGLHPRFPMLSRRGAAERPPTWSRQF